MLVMLAVRAAQFLFAATVLALSIVLIKDYGPGKAPALEGYAAFCGGAGLLINLIGVAAIFFEPLQGVVMLVLDGLATFFTLAGGIAIAVTIKVGSCTNMSYLARNVKSFVIGEYKSQRLGKNPEAKLLDSLIYRCRMTQADVAVLWFLFGTFAATSALHFFTSKRAKAY